MKKIIVSILAAASALDFSAAAPARDFEADVVVYGGTSAAVVSAIRVAQAGKKVCLVSPDINLGAMSSSGLGLTDSGKTSSIGGLSREFYRRVYKEYLRGENWFAETRENFGGTGQETKAIDEQAQTMWIFEPRVASNVFNYWLAEFPNIIVHRGEFLDRRGGVEKENGRIKSISTLSGKKYAGKIFVDATFEGDLMAAAGCQYVVGRESNAQYGEDYNGYRATLRHNYHNFKAKVSPYKIAGKKSSGLLKYVSAARPPENGAADKRVQAYNYRLCLTDYPPNKLPLEKPANYDPADYELCGRWFEAYPEAFPLIISQMPNRKTDINNRQAFSTDFIGQNYAYPEASYAERARIVAAHKNYTLGLLYFYNTDPRVPQKFRNAIKNFGLPKDEFKDTANWPFYLYIREARRLVGEYVMTQRDCQNAKVTPESIAMGSYTLDSHNTSRFVDADGFAQNEGDVQVGIADSGPYEISYGSIIPKRKDCRNLYVVCAVSASHIAYGSIRMEPVFMALGHAAGTAALQCVELGRDVQDVNYRQLAWALRKEGQILHSEK